MNILSSICWALTLVVFQVGSASAIDLQPGTTSVSLSGQLDYLSDKTGALDLQQVIAAHRTGSMQKLPGFLNRGYTDATSWLHFSVSRATDVHEDVYLWMSPPLVDEVDVYLQVGSAVDAPESYQKISLGDHTPVADKPLQHAKLILPLALKDAGTREIYVRVKSGSSHTLRLWLMSPAAFVEETGESIILQGGHVAIALVLGIVNLLLALRLRDRVYGYYGLYLLSIAIGYLGIDGLLTLLVPSIVHQVSDLLAAITTGLGFAILTSFLMALFETHKGPKWLHRYLQATVVLGIATFALHATPWYGGLANLTHFNGLLLILVVMSRAWILMRQGNTMARLLFIAFFASSLGGFVTFMRLVGILPTNHFTFYAFQYCGIIHMVVMTLALSERVLEAEALARVTLKNAEKKATDLANAMTVQLRENYKKLEQTLASEQKTRAEQERFIDIVSHEYRTPLATIQTNLDIVQFKASSMGAIDQNISLMNRAIKRLGELFNNSLLQSEFAHGHTEAERIELNAFASELVAEVQSNHGGKMLALEQTEAEPATILANPIMLKTALLNGLENALKYSPAASPVLVRIYRMQDQVILTITNQLAAPMDPDHEKLFEKFHRGSSSHGISGLGVGLYLVKSIIEDQGGNLDIETTGYAPGDEFILHLQWPLATGANT